ncbi:hypothetical protein B0H21DRAFT_736163 [Amylocystis lapponica]|nr:hypothetical protein B0H21DRAFT_736163 [Amylocystis lapponica]
MLSRNATHRVACPIIAFEFLAPGFLLNRTASTKSSLRRTPVRLDGAPRGPKSLVPPVPSSSSAHSATAAALLNKLDQQLQVFHQQLPGSRTDSQELFFNRTIPELNSAFRNSDIDRAWSLWTELKVKKLLDFLTPSQSAMYSKFVASVCQAQSPDRVWSNLEAEALSEIALATAARGASEGLTAYMLAHIKQNNSKTALRLYGRYLSLLREQEAGTPWAKQDEDDLGAGVDSGSSAVTYTIVRADVVLAAITAHAVQDAFADALHDIMQVSVRFTPNTTNGFLARLNKPLREKVADFVRRLDTGRLLARPGTFAKQLSNLSRDYADRSLERLYTVIVAGLTGPQQWLTAHPSEVGKERPVLVPDFAWALFITGFLRCRKLNLAEKLWDDIIRLQIRPTVDMWNALIAGYADLKMMDEASSTWTLLQSQGYKPDTWTHRALIWGFFHAGQPEQGLQRFQAYRKDLPTMSPHPDASAVLVVYNTTLHGLLFHSQTGHAHALLQDMQQHGPKPDIVTFNNFLRYYGRKGDLKMMGDILDMIEPAGLVGDVFTFSILLSALLKVRNDAPQIILNLMEKQGVKPNTATLSSIIDHQMRAQTETNLRSALELLAKMEQSGLEDTQPNEVTYTSILTGIHRRNWLEPRVADEYRQLIWGKMLARDIVPSRVTYNILIKACLENPEPLGLQNALFYFRDMQKRRIFIANDTWYIILLGLVGRKEWALANELVQDLQNSGFVPAAALAELVDSLVYRSFFMMKWVEILSRPGKTTPQVPV